MAGGGIETMTLNRMAAYLFVLCLATAGTPAFAGSISIDSLRNGLDEDGAVVVNRAPGATGRTGRTMTLTGSTTAASTSLSVNCRYESGGDAVAWTKLGAVTVAGGRWSGSVNVPLSKDWLTCRVRDDTSNSVSSFQRVKWGVGITWLWIGQSNFARAYQLAPVTLKADERTQVFSHSGWHSFDWRWPAWEGDSPINDNARVFANATAEACDCVVGIMPFVVTATTIQQWLDMPRGGDIWRLVAGSAGDGDAVPYTVPAGAPPGVVLLEHPVLKVGEVVGYVGPARIGRNMTVGAVNGNQATLIVSITGRPFDAVSVPQGQLFPFAGLSSPLLVGHDFEGAIWQQGENNAGAPKQGYYDLLGRLWHQLLSLTGRQPQQFAFGVVPIGTAGMPESYLEGIRQADLQFIADHSNAGVFYAGSYLDGAHKGGDGVHAGPDDYRHFFRRLTQASLHAARLSPRDAAGPHIVGAVMPVGGSVVTVRVAQDGGTRLEDASGNAAASGLQGFRVLRNGAPCAVVSASIAGPDTLSISTQCTRGPKDAMALDYLYGSNPFGMAFHATDEPRAVYDNNLPLAGTDYADDLGAPLQPTLGLVKVAP